MMQSSRHRLFAFGMLVLGIAAGIWYWGFRTSSEQHWREAERAFDKKQYSRAEVAAGKIAEGSPYYARALLLAGKSALQRGRPREAVVYLDRVAANSGEPGVAARFLAGEILLTRLYRPADAEQQLRRALDENPQHVPTLQLLVRLLSATGRHWETVAPRLELLRKDAFTENDLVLLAQPDATRDDVKLLEELAERNPNDLLVKLGVAVADLREQRTERAETLLREVADSMPTLAEAQAQLGTLLLQSGRTAEFRAWYKRLPADVDRHPEIWALRADYARLRGDLNGAARCYWESLRRDSCRQRSAYQLGQMLLALEEPDQAAPFLDRAAMLQDMQLLMKRHAGSPGADTIQEAANLCEKLGLWREAWCWSRLALANDPWLAWAEETTERLAPRLASVPDRTSINANPVEQVDLSDLTVPRWENPADDSPHKDAEPKARNIQFVDEASDVGLNFSYFNDDNPETPAARPFEFTGGGVAVLDYDGDGWPDVYLTQGCRFPIQEDQAAAPEHTDRLFRNLGNGRFEDVTDSAGLREDRYSQGVTVGDYNDDGCPDLYVANLDANRHYRNNGDGTFTDVTIECGTGGDGWTTSCLMADLNGDAWPDICAVNYLAGRDVFERICRDSSGRPRICTPHDFEPARDQFWLNLGDGRFEDWTEESGIGVPHGKGLGIVAVDVTGTGRLNLFIANDTDANSYFVNETTEPGAPPRLREDAIASGLAFDRDGRTQACMGIAVGDANEDGLLDLFVTNYYHEANTLYLQQAEGLFQDAAQETGLRESSLATLGFGTQFVDGEQDGHQDLIATNGHVEDNRSRNIPYQMRPQYFANRAGQSFEELADGSAGSFFQKELLGRGLARLDWNRDGRDDIVISHLDAPAALLTNRTEGSGHYLSIQLRGVRSSRDAIGTAVQLGSGEKTWTQQLTAGDGYHASNQRQLIFGLGERDHVDEMIVRWPSGQVQQFPSPAINTELLVIEGKPESMKVPK